MKAKINIEGMHCASCASNVKRSLSKIKGTNNINVNPIAGKAFLEVDKKVSKDKLKAAIKDAGFNPKEVEFLNHLLQLLLLKKLNFG